MRRRNIVWAAFLVLVGCHAVPMWTPLESNAHSIGCRPSDCGDPARLISVTYLGVSGLVIEHQGHVLLTAPFFSNPSLERVAPRLDRLLRSTPRISSDTGVIERFLPRDADRATTILVGHGHYDHLMDIPFIATRRAKSAVIYGSPSVRHMLMGDSTLRANGGARVVAISPDSASSDTRAGIWYYSSDSAFRFMAVIAGHAPTYKLWKPSYTFTAGPVTADLDSLPHTAAEWKLGEPYAYVIDVMSDRRPVFRIYFQDAPSEPPLGFPAPAVLAERPVDLVVLCAATSSNVSNAPDSLLMVLKPRHVMLGHWEDFFRPHALPAQVGIATDLEALEKSLKRSVTASQDWGMPFPGTMYRFRESPF
jgi:hypothetical protein